jgi:hypothetical protein
MVETKTNGTMRNCSSGAFQWMVMSLCNIMTILFWGQFLCPTLGHHRSWKCYNLDIGFVYWRLLHGTEWSNVGVPHSSDCVTSFLNVVAIGDTIRWNRHITPDLCLATSWLHDLMYTL